MLQVPSGEDVPLVLVPVTESDGLAPHDLAIISAEADRFVLEASSAGTRSQPDPKQWKQAQQNSDELFRTWYGTDAYMAMQARRYLESRISDQP